MGAELARAERLTALGRMSAGLAHEIRNPIGAMRLQAENALAKGTVEAYQKACRDMLQNISRLDDLLERLLAIVRLDRLTLRVHKNSAMARRVRYAVPKRTGEGVSRRGSARDGMVI